MKNQMYQTESKHPAGLGLFLKKKIYHDENKGVRYPSEFRSRMEDERRSGRALFLITRLASGNTPHNTHACYQHITSCCLSNLKHSMKLLSEMSLAGYNFILGLLTGSICKRCIPGECWW